MDSWSFSNCSACPLKASLKGRLKIADKFRLLLRSFVNFQGIVRIIENPVIKT